MEWIEKTDIQAEICVCGTWFEYREGYYFNILNGEKRKFSKSLRSLDIIVARTRADCSKYRANKLYFHLRVVFLHLKMAFFILYIFGIQWNPRFFTVQTKIPI